jgi:hypothetical protein
MVFTSFKEARSSWSVVWSLTVLILSLFILAFLGFKLISLFSMSLIIKQKKLECLCLPSISSPVKYWPERLEGKLTQRAVTLASKYLTRLEKNTLAYSDRTSMMKQNFLFFVNSVVANKLECS